MAEDFNHFEQLAEAFERATSQIVRKTAFDIQAGYVSRAPKDTGFMANSAYVVTSQESTYGQGGGSAPKDAYLLPEVEKPDDNQTAYVSVGANYAIFVEMGTRFAPAQPAFYPAVDAAQGPFEDALARIEEKMREAGG